MLVTRSFLSTNWLLYMLCTDPFFDVCLWGQVILSLSVYLNLPFPFFLLRCYSVVALVLFEPCSYLCLSRHDILDIQLVFL